MVIFSLSGNLSGNFNILDIICNHPYRWYMDGQVNEVKRFFFDLT